MSSFTKPTPVYFDDSDGYVEAIYATEAAAEAARLAAIRKAIADGEDVYYNPDTGEDFPETWRHDWRVEHHIVISEPAAEASSARQDIGLDGGL